MTYGLLVTSSNSSNQIDSDTYDEGISVSYRSAGNVSSVSGSEFDPYNGDLLFIRRNDNSADYYVFIEPSGGNYLFKKYAGGMRPNISMSAGTAYVQCMVAKKQGRITATGGYGLQVKKPDGTVGFDSRAFTTDHSFVMESFVSSGSIQPGAYPADGGGVKFSSATGRWVLANWATRAGNSLAVRAAGFRTGNDGLYYYGAYDLGGVGSEIGLPRIIITPNFSDIILATGG